MGCYVLLFLLPSLFLLTVFQLSCCADDDGEQMPNKSRAFAPFCLRKPKTVVNGTKGQKAFIPCRIVGIPRPNIVWHYNNQRMDMDVNRTRVTPTGLKFNPVKWKDAGLYTCYAYNRFGEKRINITLFVRALLKPGPPKWKWLSNSQPNVQKGKKVKMTCKPKGIPRPVISWFRNGQLIRRKQTKRLKMTRFTLIIKKANESDAGTYTCKAKNVHGSKQNNFNLTVNVVKFAPIFKRTSKRNQRVRVNGTVRFRCKVDGEPYPFIIWYRGDTAIHPFSSPSTIVKRYVLTVSPVEENDAGNYSCKAWNEMGVIWANYTLSVYIDDIPADKPEPGKGVTLKP